MFLTVHEKVFRFVHYIGLNMRQARKKKLPCTSKEKKRVYALLSDYFRDTF